MFTYHLTTNTKRKIFLIFCKDVWNTVIFFLIKTNKYCCSSKVFTFQQKLWPLFSINQSKISYISKKTYLILLHSKCECNRVNMGEYPHQNWSLGFCLHVCESSSGAWEIPRKLNVISHWYLRCVARNSVLWLGQRRLISLHTFPWSKSCWLKSCRKDAQAELYFHWLQNPKIALLGTWLILFLIFLLYMQNKMVVGIL